MRIRQVATLLGYGEPQILQVFKNTLPTRLYWIDMQLAEYSSSNQFMSIK